MIISVPTESLPVAKTGNDYKKMGMMILGSVTVFAIGFFLSHITWPRYVEVEKIVEKRQMVRFPEEERKPPVQRDLSLEIEKRADTKIISLFESSWKGVLIVKDNKAQTVLRNRAALGRTVLGNKQGFVDLKNDSYTVHNYFTYLDTGYGIVDDGQQNFFLLLWSSGATKAPLINPGTINLVKGITIEPGEAKKFP